MGTSPKKLSLIAKGRLSREYSLYSLDSRYKLFIARPGQTFPIIINGDLHVKMRTVWSFSRYFLQFFRGSMPSATK